MSSAKLSVVLITSAAMIGVGGGFLVGALAKDQVEVGRPAAKLAPAIATNPGAAAIPRLPVARSLPALIHRQRPSVVTTTSSASEVGTIGGSAIVAPTPTTSAPSHAVHRTTPPPAKGGTIHQESGNGA